MDEIHRIFSLSSWIPFTHKSHSIKLKSLQSLLDLIILTEVLCCFHITAFPLNSVSLPLSLRLARTPSLLNISSSTVGPNLTVYPGQLSLGTVAVCLPRKIRRYFRSVCPMSCTSLQRGCIVEWDVWNHIVCDGQDRRFNAYCSAISHLSSELN